MDWANLLLEDGGDGRRVDSSGDGDGSSGADGACGCCGDAEAGWRLLMAVTGLTGAARRSRGRLGPLRSLLLRFAQIASSVCADCFFVILSCSYYKTRLGQPSSGRWEEGKEGENPCCWRDGCTPRQRRAIELLPRHAEPSPLRSSSGIHVGRGDSSRRRHVSWARGLCRRFAQQGQCVARGGPRRERGGSWRLLLAARSTVYEIP